MVAKRDHSDKAGTSYDREEAIKKAKHFEHIKGQPANRSPLS